MRRPQALLAALLLAAPLALATDGNNRMLTAMPGPYAKNASQKGYFTVLFSSLTINGEKSSMKALKAANTSSLPAAMTVTFASEGLPQLRADYDSATVSVTRNQAVATADRAVEVQVFACYAKASLFDRGWRKPSNSTELDKQCPWYVDTLPVNGGNTTWHINPDIPKAIMFLRAYQMCHASADDDELVACAFGNSPGVVQVNPIQTHPTNLIAGVIVCLFIGPLCLVGFYIYESKFKKWD